MNEVEEITNYNVAARKQTFTGIFHGGLIEGIHENLVVLTNCPWVSEDGYPIDPKKFGCDVSVHPSARPHRLWGRGRKVARQPDRVWRMPSFLGVKSRGAFGQLRFSWREIA